METLEEQVEKNCLRFSIDGERKNYLSVGLDLIKNKHDETYNHSLRVGLKCAALAEFTHAIEPEKLFYSGILHDVGKTLISDDSLKKTKDFGEKDREEMQKHVEIGFNMVKGVCPTSAWIIFLHHYFQPNERGYPTKLPEEFNLLSKGLKTTILYSARLLSFADFYDAATNRDDGKFGEGLPSRSRVKELIIEENLDQNYLISELYNQGIF